MATLNPRKFAVVTGASTGIGFELARHAIQHGFDVLVVSETSAIESAAEELNPSGSTVQPLIADLATRAGCELLAREVETIGRPIDALILNAGVGVGGEFLTNSLEAELAMIALNCNHTVHVAKRLLPAMVARGEGMVLITGSVVSTAPNPYQAVYGATKAFVMSFGEALRVELADKGISVTVLQPGATDTEFFTRAHLENTEVGQAKKDDPALVAKQGFEAMLAGKDSVLAGSLKSRAQGLMNEVLPETMKAKQAGKQTKPLDKA